MEPESRSQQLSSANDNKQIQLLPPQDYFAELDKNEDSGLNVSQFLTILRRRWLVVAGIFGSITAATLFLSLLSKPSYMSYLDVLPETSTGETQLLSSVSGTLENKSQGGTSITSNTSSKDETLLNVLKSSKLLSPVIAALKTKYPDMKAKNANMELALFLQDLTVTKTQNTQIIHVEYKNSNKDKVKDAIKLLSKAYLAYSLQETQKEVRQGLKFLENQLPAVEAQVDGLQARLQGFRQQYNLVDPATQGQQISSQKSTFAEQRLNAQVQLEQTKAIYADLQKQLTLKPGMAAASPLNKGTRYQDVLNKMLEVESKIAQESTLFRMDTPNVKVLRDQQRNLIPLLTQERDSVLRDVSSQIRETQNQLKSINQAENALNEQVKQYAVLSRYYDDLQRKLKIATDNLSELLSKREALLIEVAQKEIPWQLLTPPTEPSVSSKLLLKLLLGSTLGLLLGIGTALLLDYRKRALYTVDDIEGITRVPVLAVVPFNKKLKKLASKGSGLFSNQIDSVEGYGFPLNNGKQLNDVDSYTFLEVFRSLYINTRFLRPDNPIRSLAVTSATPGSGSSTVAIHLAKAAAMVGQRVLLVDANLQSPMLHTLLGVENTLGLGNLIATDVEWNRAIQSLALPTAFNPSLEQGQLSVLTAGQALQDPTLLLSSSKMQTLKQSLQATFDLVIYDTSSLADGVDSSLMATETDGLLMVVSLGHTTHAALSQAFNRIKYSPVSVLGIVANGAKKTSTQKRSKRSARTLAVPA
jgi:capsular exopolysaccharide synthesis family protein